MSEVSKRAFVGLDRLRGIIQLSDAIVEKTAYIYRQAQERGLMRGRTMRAILGAGIYIVQRRWGFQEPWTTLSKQQTQKKKTWLEPIGYCYAN